MNASNGHCPKHLEELNHALYFGENNEVFEIIPEAHINRFTRVAMMNIPLFQTAMQI